MSGTAPPRNPAAAPAARPLPRGIRNHNPGNIRHNASVSWRGQAPAQPDPEFVTFDTPEMGLRAICRILLSYAQRGVKSPRAIAHRWAPPNGRRPDGTTYAQDSDAYARHLAAAVGAGLDTALDVRNPTIMRGLLMAIVRHENGQQPYSRDQLDTAMDLAGLELDPAAAPARTPAR